MPTGKSTKPKGAKSTPEFHKVFERLLAILKKHQGKFTVMVDKPAEYGFGGPVGPASIKAWGGNAKRKTIMLTWLKVGKNYVSCHLLGLYANPKLLAGISKELKARMQGKACFNFSRIDEPLFKELSRLTSDSLTDMKKAGFVA